MGNIISIEIKLNWNSFPVFCLPRTQPPSPLLTFSDVMERVVLILLLAPVEYLNPTGPYHNPTW